MGNWRRVQIIGTCAETEVEALATALDPGPNYENFHCLVNGGVCGLQNWAAESFSVVGNLAERGYNAESVAETLRDIAGNVPSLTCEVHVGDDHESDECVATVTLKDGEAVVGKSKKDKIPEITRGQMEGSLLKQLMRPPLKQ